MWYIKHHWWRCCVFESIFELVQPIFGSSCSWLYSWSIVIHSFPALYSVTFTSSSFNCQLILTMMALHLIMLVAWESDFILLYFDSPFLLLTIAKTSNDTTLMQFWNFLLMEEEGEMVKFGIIIIYGSSIRDSTRVHLYETYTFLLFPLHNKNKNNNTFEHGTNQNTNQSPYNDTVLSRAKQVVSRLYYYSSPEITPPHSTIQTIPHSSLTLSRSKCRLRCLSGYSNNGDGGWMIPRKKEWMKIKKRYTCIGE